MLLPSSIQRAEDLVGMATPIRSPLAAKAGVSAVEDSAIAPSARPANVRLLITFHSLEKTASPMRVPVRPNPYPRRRVHRSDGRISGLLKAHVKRSLASS